MTTILENFRTPSARKKKKNSHLKNPCSVEVDRLINELSDAAPVSVAALEPPTEEWRSQLENILDASTSDAQHMASLAAATLERERESFLRKLKVKAYHLDHLRHLAVRRTAVRLFRRVIERRLKVTMRQCFGVWTLLAWRDSKTREKAMLDAAAILEMRRRSDHRGTALFGCLLIGRRNLKEAAFKRWRTLSMQWTQYRDLRQRALQRRKTRAFQLWLRLSKTAKADRIANRFAVILVLSKTLVRWTRRSEGIRGLLRRRFFMWRSHVFWDIQSMRRSASSALLVWWSEHQKRHGSRRQRRAFALWTAHNQQRRRKLEDQLRRSFSVFYRSRKDQMKDAWATWKRRSHVFGLLRTALHRVCHFRIAAALTKWRLAVEDRRVLLKARSRLVVAFQRDRRRDAWGRWRRWTRLGRRMATLLQRHRKDERRSAFLRWTRNLAHQKRCARMTKRLLSYLASRSKTAAFFRWKRTNFATRAVARRFFGVARRNTTAAAFSTWRRATLRKTNAVNSLVVVRKFIARDQRAASFRRWYNAVVDRRRFARILRTWTAHHEVNALNRAWAAWKATTAMTGVLSTIKRSWRFNLFVVRWALRRTETRRRHAVLKASFLQWKAPPRLLKLTTVLRRRHRRTLRDAFSRWTVDIHKSRRVATLFIRQKRRCCREAFARWRALPRPRNRRSLLLVAKLAAWRCRRLEETFAKWRDWSCRLAAMEAPLMRLVKAVTTTRRRLRGSFDRWRIKAALATRAMSTRAVLLWALFARKRASEDRLRHALNWWAAAAKALTVAQSQLKRRVFTAFTIAVRRSSQRQARLGSCLRHQRIRLQRRAWVQWTLQRRPKTQQRTTNAQTYLGSHDTNIQAVYTEQCLKRRERKLKVVTFRAWETLTMVRQRRKKLIKRAARRIRTRALASAMLRWSFHSSAEEKENRHNLAMMYRRQRTQRLKAVLFFRWRKYCLIRGRVNEDQVILARFLGSWRAYTRERRRLRTLVFETSRGRGNREMAEYLRVLMEDHSTTTRQQRKVYRTPRRLTTSTIQQQRGRTPTSRMHYEDYFYDD